MPLGVSKRIIIKKPREGENNKRIIGLVCNIYTKFECSSSELNRNGSPVQLLTLPIEYICNCDGFVHIIYYTYTKLKKYARPGPQTRKTKNFDTFYWIFRVLLCVWGWLCSLRSIAFINCKSNISRLFVLCGIVNNNSSVYFSLFVLLNYNCHSIRFDGAGSNMTVFSTRWIKVPATNHISCANSYPSSDIRSSHIVCEQFIRACTNWLNWLCL